MTAGVADPKVHTLLHPGATPPVVDRLTPSISRPDATSFYRGTACGEYIAAQLVSRLALVCIVEVP